MKNILFTLAAIMLIVPCIVNAQCPTGTAPTNNGVCVPTPAQTGLKNSTFLEVIGNVTRFVTGLIAVLALLMIVVSGIMYITATGDSGRVDAAKGYLTYAIIGLVVALLAYVIVTAVGRAVGAWW